MPRALNEPVGLRDSSLIQTRGATASSGVNPSVRRDFVAGGTGKHFAIAPQRRRPIAHVRARQSNGRQIVIDAQRIAAGRAHALENVCVVLALAAEAADADLISPGASLQRDLHLVDLAGEFSSRSTARCRDTPLSQSGGLWRSTNATTACSIARRVLLRESQWSSPSRLISSTGLPARRNARSMMRLCSKSTTVSCLPWTSRMGASARSAALTGEVSRRFAARAHFGPQRACQHRILAGTAQIGRHHGCEIADSRDRHGAAVQSLLQGHAGQRRITAETCAHDAGTSRVDDAGARELGQSVADVTLYLAPPFTLARALELRAVTGGAAIVRLEHRVATGRQRLCPPVESGVVARRGSTVRQHDDGQLADTRVPGGSVNTPRNAIPSAAL